MPKSSRNARVPLPALLLLPLLHAAACDSGSEPEPASEPESATESESESESEPGTETESESEPEPGSGSDTEPEPAAAADPNEACGQMLLVAFQGAKLAPDSITRSKPEALARAGSLLKRYEAEGDFAGLARLESDAPSSAARGGVFGTFTRDDWPELHAALREPLFSLTVGKTAPEPVEADYGYVLLRRCPVEKARSRHILIRYAGAKGAGDDVTRDEAAAKQRAEALLSRLKAGEDFAALAKEASEDSSAERGGDVGNRGRGLLAKAYEDALFSMQPGELRGPVKTEFGFHLIERLPPE